MADLAGEDSGGFHFRGGSSIGKTTLLRASASVWGDPSTYVRLWRTTSNGLEGMATLHNDNVLILDELGQVDPKDAGSAAYLLANGQGKVRASKVGTARASARWRLLFLSSGEEALATLMARGGQKTHVGQEIRLADIEADAGAGMGVFDVLHDHIGPGQLAEAVTRAAKHYHGAVGKAWLNQLVTNRQHLAVLAKQEIQSFANDLSPSGAGGQVLRVARRFALVGVAGEQATQCGLTGWRDGEAKAAARKCFTAWLENFGGAGDREERAILSQVKAFFEAHGASRFDNPWENPHQRIPNCVGFCQIQADDTKRFMVLPEAFKSEICGNYDHKLVTKVLLDAGLLEKGENNRPSKNIRIRHHGQRRCYIFTERIWESENDS